MSRVGVVVTDTHVRPEGLLEAIAAATAGRGHLSVEVVIPVVLPPTLPISAVPPRIAARANALLQQATASLEIAACPAQAQIAPCRSIPALLHDLAPMNRLILVGSAGWGVRRAARSVADDVTVVSDRVRRPAKQPRATGGVREVAG
jgi:hypothetical protein